MQQNRKLEDRMTSLCQSPFINDAFMKKEKMDKLLQLEQAEQTYKNQLEQLKQTSTEQLHAIQNLQLQLTEALDRAEFAEHELAGNAATPMVSATPRPRSPVARSPQRSPQKSPYRTSRRPEIPRLNLIVPDATPPSTVDFLEKQPDSERNRLHTLQVTYLSTTKELERYEKMLEAQVNINRELTHELEELQTKRQESQDILEGKLEELAALAEDRLQKIKVLEVQVKQLRYGPIHNRLEAIAEEDNQLDECASTLSTDYELEAGENVLEVWIRDGIFSSPEFNAKSCTFVICDFYDFESQSTPLMIGVEPNYNFAASFKITVDQFLLQYLSTEQLVLEVHQTHRGDFQLAGQCKLGLDALLSTNCHLKRKAQPILSVETGEKIGTLNLMVRLVNSVSDLWQMHVKTHPQDKIKAIRPSATTDEMNALEVSIVKCTNLKGNLPGIAPSPYVHYQLLGFSDTFTNIVPSSFDPEFEAKPTVFTVRVDRSFRRFLKKYQLTLTVFNDDDEEETGVIGMAKVPLIELLEGDPIQGSFELENENGRVHVEIKWKDPVKIVSKSLDRHVLSLDELYQTLECFSQDSRVDYKKFIRFTLPSPDLLQLIQHIRNNCTCLADVFNDLDVLSLSDVMDKFSTLGVPIEENQIQMIFKARKQIDRDEFLLFFDQPPCKRQVLEDKLRITMKNYINEPFHSMEKVTQPFERYDLNQTGFTSRAEFKRALKLFGFDIHDDTMEEPVKNPLMHDFEERKTLFLNRMKHASREKPLPIEHPPVAKRQPLPNLTVGAKSLPSVPVNILETEKALSSTMTTELKRELVSRFHQLDRNRTGLVTKSQFAHVLNQFQIPQRHLKCLLEYFTAMEGTDVNYSECIAFFNYQTRQKGSSMVKFSIETKAAVDVFQQFDPMQSGIVSLSDFTKGLFQLGLNISQAQAIEIMSAFNSKGLGVLYRYFIAYISDLPHSIELRQIQAKLRKSLDSIDSVASIKDLLTAQEFTTVLSRFSPTLSVLLKWIQDYNSMEIHDSNLKDLEEICWNVSRERNIKPQELFQHYDWKRSGFIPFEMFAKCLIELQYPLTNAHVRLIAKQFTTSHGLVEYYSFFKWIRPPTIDLNVLKVQTMLKYELKFENLSRQACHELFPLEPEAFKLLMDAYDPFKTDCVAFQSLEPILQSLKQDRKQILSKEQEEIIQKFFGVNFKGPLKKKLKELKSKTDFEEIFQQCVDEGIHYRYEFERLDTELTGVLTAKQVEGVFEEMGFQVEMEMEHVNYLQLFPKFNAVEEELRLKIRLKAGKQQFRRPETLDSAFRHFDRFNRGVFDQMDLFHGLEAIGIKISMEETRSLFDQISLTTSDVISRAEFNVFVIDPYYKQVEEKIVSLLKKDRDELNHEFNLKDPNDLKSIPTKEFMSCFKSYDISTRDLTRLSFRFDLTHSGRIAYKLFSIVLSN